MPRSTKRCRRSPTMCESRGSQYRSWAFGHRLRTAGLFGSSGRVGSAADNALMESFLGALQLQLLDRRRWTTPAQLGSAIFEWIEGWHDPRRVIPRSAISAPSTTHTCTLPPKKRHDRYT